MDPLPNTLWSRVLWGKYWFESSWDGFYVAAHSFPINKEICKASHSIKVKRTSSGRLEMVIRCDCYKTLGSLGLHWIEGLFLWTCLSCWKVCLSPTISFLIGIGIFLHRGLAKESFSIKWMCLRTLRFLREVWTNWISFFSANRIFLPYSLHSMHPPY